MADIYLAHQIGLERLVAVKVLSAPRARDAESAALFMDEARLVGMLSHANLAAVHEVATAGDVHYLAMEYVHGADLRALLTAAQKAQQPVPYDAACAIVIAAAAGLDHAHRRCGPDGRPLLLPRQQRLRPHARRGARPLRAAVRASSARGRCDGLRAAPSPTTRPRAAAARCRGSGWRPSASAAPDRCSASRAGPWT